MLKYKYPTKEQIPSDHAALYGERDGAWFLNAEGVVEASQLDELRKQKTALQQQLEGLNQRFEGIDPDNVRAQLDEKRKLEEEQAIKSGEHEKVFQSRLRDLRSEYDKRHAELKTERDALTSRLTEIQVNQGVIIAGTKRGLRATAIPDITSRARSTFKLVNGEPRAFEADGTTVRTGSDGMTPMSIEEWVEGQISEAPHLFGGNTGGGAVGNAGSGAPDVANPWKRETWNLTKQGELLRKDPVRARAMQANAK